MSDSKLIALVRASECLKSPLVKLAGTYKWGLQICNFIRNWVKKENYGEGKYLDALGCWIAAALRDSLVPLYSVCIYLQNIQPLFLFICLFVCLGCVGSSGLHAGFLQLRWAGSALCCGARASHCGGFSCCGAQALGMQASIVVAHRLQSAGPVAVAHGTSCSAACEIFPDQGSNPRPLHWQAEQTLNHCTTREALSLCF